MASENNGNGRLDTEKRFSRVDSELSRIDTEVKGVRHDFGILGEKFDAFADEMRRQMFQSSRTPWATLISAVALILAIGAIFGNQYSRDLERTEQGVEKLTEAMTRHLMSDGHSTVTQRVSSLERGQKNLDAVLQREMRLLDETQTKHIEGLDKRLQIEMRLLDKQNEIELKSLRERVTTIESWQRSNNTSSVAKHAGASERLKALERITFGSRWAATTRATP